MEPPESMRELMGEYLKIVSYSSERIVVRAEPEGAQSAFLIGALVLAILGVSSMVASFTPTSEPGGGQGIFLGVAAVALVTAAVGALVARFRYSPPEVTFRRGEGSVEVRNGNKATTVPLGEPAFGVIRFAVRALGRASLLLHLGSQQSLTLATNLSDKLEKLRRIAEFLEAFTKRKE